MPTIRIGARQVCRAFGPVVANDRVDLAVAPGSIHAVIGENGAGKTTLMRILYGLDQPDDGTVIIDDEDVALSHPRDALARGIGMVHQELSVIGELTLLENLVLGKEPRRGMLIDWETASGQAKELGERTGVQLEWHTLTAKAPVNARQQLEILRLLYQGADVLILDEPTAALAPAQVSELFRLLRDLADDGHTMVFISHKLDEVLSLADTVTILRAGRTVASMPTVETAAAQLAELMVGAEVPAPPQASPADAGEVVLTVQSLAARDDRGIARLNGVDFAVRAGEIVGVAGVTGNGTDELVEVVVGLRRPTAGSVAIDAVDVTRLGVGGRRHAGLAFISPDRRREGLAVDASLSGNTIAGHHRKPELTTAGWTRPRAVERFARALLQRFGVRHDRLSAPAASLSGGNQQRLVAARELGEQPRVLIAAQPTRGVDVKGISFIHSQLIAIRDAGSAVMLVSEELDELLRLSDRIVVLYGGRVTGEIERKDFDRAHLGRLMTGRSEVDAVEKGRQ